MNILGNSLEEIASEKAGIIKKNTAVVIGISQNETNAIFEQTAKRLDAPLIHADQQYSVLEINHQTELLHCIIRNNDTGTVMAYKLDLPGLYQVENLCTVLCCFTVLNNKGFTISLSNIEAGLANTKKNTGIRGRWEIKSTNPVVILDVAHNEAGIRQVLHQLDQHYSNQQKHFILGFVKDKELAKVLQLFPATADYYFTNAHIPRALQADTLRQQAAENNLKGLAYDNVNEALRAAIAKADINDVIVVCGSFFVIAELD